MKNKLTTLFLALSAGFAFGHGDIELGPNKGRILEFSTNETMHGEVTEKDGKLHIAVLDKDMKPVKVEAQSLTATAGTREKPVKLEVAKDDKGFTVAAPAAGEWLIVQYKEKDDAKPITARLHYETKVCGECDKPEWMCACGEKK
jgi:hypothetical protein